MSMSSSSSWASGSGNAPRGPKDGKLLVSFLPAIREFREQAELRTVERIVHQARHDLDELHPLALPELLERLGRQRLLETAGR
jgi:hypothetical protein